jgi:hypothetical protein
MSLDPRLVDVVDRVEECWIRLRMTRSVRRTLVTDLEADLAAAVGAGTPVAALVPDDVVR